MITWIRKGSGRNGYVGYIGGKYSGWEITGLGHAVGGWDVYRDGYFVKHFNTLDTAQYWVLGRVVREAA